MLKAKAGGRSKRGREETLATKCASIPGMMYAERSLTGARRELAEVAAVALEGAVIVERRGKGTAHTSRDLSAGDALANLWFVRAAYEFAAAAEKNVMREPESREHREFATGVLLPLCKRIIQEFISENGIAGARMDDGGMLVITSKHAKTTEVHPAPLRYNALWYSALEITGQALSSRNSLGSLSDKNGARDRTSDHFERLAGRFRRAFSKACWCTEHNRICPTETRQKDNHGTLPDAEQLLLTVLPASPLPRTKQREAIAQIAQTALGQVGVLIHHPEYGLVESTLHRAWLAQGATSSAENNADRDKAAEIMRGLANLAAPASGAGIHAFYLDGQPLGRVDAFATAEVLGTLARYSVG